MSVFRQIAVRVKDFLFKLPKQFNADSLLGNKPSFGGKMLTRKIEEDDCDIPNKKLCTQERGENAETEQPVVKFRKRMVALLLAYCGTDYCGMQVNSNVRTVEGELLSAMQKADCIPLEALSDAHVINFQRAARTDKGVSAAKQVVSFKILENFNVETINSFLPEDIRVFSIRRVTKGFNCKNDCKARTYSYTLPTFALAPELHEEYPENYRITPEVITRVNEILSSYLGTRKFHNFTVKKLSKDPSARRYIMSFKAEEPFVDGEEFITLTIKGQSFMLHQIRKMVGHTISILKGLTPPNFETDVWSDKKYSVLMAPGLGLVLENVHYDTYNRKYGQDGIHETLTWDELSDEIQAFKAKHILPNIIKREREERLMFNWILSQREHTYEYLEENDKLEETSDEKNDDKVIHANKA